MAAQLRSYCEALASAVSVADGKTTARLLTVHKDRSPATAALLSSVAGYSLADCEGQITRFRTLQGKWVSVAGGCLLASQKLKEGNYVAAFALLADALHALNDIVEESEMWIIVPLHRVVMDAEGLLKHADAQARAVGQRDEHDGVTKAFVAHVRESFNFCLNHRVPKEQVLQSRRMGALMLANLSCKLFLRQDRPRQSSIFIQAIEGPTFPPLDRFPISQVVTYNYYRGKLAMFEDAWAKADLCLSFCLAHCPVGYRANRRRILEALIPVRLHLGVLPSMRLLEKYGMRKHYEGLVRGVRDGDVASFRACLDAGSDYFIAQGTYLLLEKLSHLVLRTFLKRCALALQHHQLKLSVLAAALTALGGGEQSIEELECMIAWLIHRKIVKGYLSHRPPVLVIAKDNAFPKISEVMRAR